MSNQGFDTEQSPTIFVQRRLAYEHEIKSDGTELKIRVIIY